MPIWAQGRVSLLAGHFKGKENKASQKNKKNHKNNAFYKNKHVSLTAIEYRNIFFLLPLHCSTTSVCAPCISRSVLKGKSRDWKKNSLGKPSALKGLTKHRPPLHVLFLKWIVNSRGYNCGATLYLIQLNLT